MRFGNRQITAKNVMKRQDPLAKTGGPWNQQEITAYALTLRVGL
jgi:hypothetical protein